MGIYTIMNKFVTALLVLACTLELVFTAPVITARANFDKALAEINTNRQLLGSGRRRRRRRRKCTVSAADITNIQSVDGGALTEVANSAVASAVSIVCQNCAGSAAMTCGSSWSLEGSTSTEFWTEETFESSVSVTVTSGTEFSSVSGTLSTTFSSTYGEAETTDFSTTLDCSCTSQVSAGTCRTLTVDALYAEYEATVTATYEDDCGDSTEIEGMVAFDNVPTSQVSATCSINYCSSDYECSEESATSTASMLQTFSRLADDACPTDFTPVDGTCTKTMTGANVVDTTDVPKDTVTQRCASTEETPSGIKYGKRPPAPRMRVSAKAIGEKANEEVEAAATAGGLSMDQLKSEIRKMGKGKKARAFASEINDVAADWNDEPAEEKDTEENMQHSGLVTTGQIQADVANVVPEH